jgi:putative oxygen-independent coproporphyrinogen III oxidase
VISAGPSPSIDAAVAPVATTPLAQPPTARPPVALYIHIPFCVSLCPYCDFVVYPGAAARGPRNRVRAFLGALRTELRLRADALDELWGPAGAHGRPVLESVYLGGGTPSLLPPADVAELLEIVRERFGLAPGSEVTLEANPGPDERGDPVAFAAAGVNRISFGAQSLNAAELRRLGRRHRPHDVKDAVVHAREAGITSINLDLLYDVSGGTVATWDATLTAALEMAPDHLSLYALTLDDPDAESLTGPLGDHLPTTRGARQWRTRARQGQDDDRAVAQYQLATARLADDGWRGYEISNWARPGRESRHNLAYWQRRSYEAVGPGAHAFDGRTRRWNAARLDGYVAALSPGDGTTKPSLPPGGSETIDAETAAAESVILALRLDSGLPMSIAAQPPLAGVLDWAIDSDLLVQTADDRIALTTRGRLLSNELFARLV